VVEDFQKMKNKALPLPGRVVESTVPPVVFVEDIQDLVQLYLNIFVEDIPMKALMPNLVQLYQKTQLSLN
jgi:hypothetical protein